MAHTAVEKILLRHAVDPLERIAPGQIVTCNIDYAGMHEGVDNRKFDQFAAAGELRGVFDSSKVGLFMGHHFCTTHDDRLAENYRLSREWCAKLGIPVHDLGSGIAHLIVMEQGLAYPGALCVFGDSHACAYGAVGAISAQCGIELPHVFMTGTLWFKVPATHRYVIEGTPRPGVYARDVVQHIVGEVKMDASVYKCIEWDGSYIHGLPVSQRFPFTLMTVELGGKCSFIEPDLITLKWLEGRVSRPFEVVASDPDAEIEKTFHFDVSDLEPQIALPGSPENSRPLSAALGEPVDQVCFGTCTGGSLDDFREAARILEGRRVKTRTLLVPGTQAVFGEIADAGLLPIFVNAGCDIFPAYCGTCQMLSVGHLAPGETQMHAGPRNWPGRAAEGAQTYLASPATCAATAVEGRVADPRNYL